MDKNPYKLEPSFQPRGHYRAIQLRRSLFKTKYKYLMLWVLSSLTIAACTSTPRPVHHHKPTPAHQAVASIASCPLTGMPIPNGQGVPQRAALAVKVDNYPDARPQSGLDYADVVFEEPVEGGITRYVAVFQCQNAPLVGPIRSARNIDIGILGQLGSPILAHVGGIQPVLNNIDNSPLINLDLRGYGSILQNLPGRVAPYDTYASTSALWGVEPQAKTVPPALFLYSTAKPNGVPVSNVNIPFSSYSNVVWRYDASINAYQRFYGTKPDVLADGHQNTATNVIVQFVQISYGPWYENSQGGLEVQADLYPNASGPAQIYENGVEINATWQHGALGSTTQYLNSTGQPIALQPGPTWVELVPNTVTVTSTK